MEYLSNIYGNGSQIYCPTGKTYRYAQLKEHIHSVTVEHVLKHEVICGSVPTREKRGEGKTAAERQLSRASSCEAATSSQG
jgi:hypothetical protein